MEQECNENGEKVGAVVERFTHAWTDKARKARGAAAMYSNS